MIRTVGELLGYRVTATVTCARVLNRASGTGVRSPADAL
jgi:hypothetical protein